MQGRSADYRPLDITIHGEFEVLSSSFFHHHPSNHPGSGHRDDHGRLHQQGDRPVHRTEEPQHHRAVQEEGGILSKEDNLSATMLMAPSGRNALRGEVNLWGAVDTATTAVGTVGRNHIKAVQDRMGLESIQYQVTFVAK